MAFYTFIPPFVLPHQAEWHEVRGTGTLGQFIVAKSNAAYFSVAVTSVEK